jgi:transcription elongation GreA/GreB family factor
MGIECDGAGYHSSRSARDRDRLREEVLTRLGWKLHRIWSTDWFNDPRTQALRLREAIGARIQELEDPRSSTLASSGEVEAKQEAPAIPSGDIEEREPIQEMPPIEETEPAEDTDEGPGTYIEIGDTVSIRYLSGTQSSLKMTISQERNDPKVGIVHESEPLASALLGAEQATKSRFWLVRPSGRH